MTEDLLLEAPDPEAFGKIRNIVKSAHKWGGNGVIPKFRKIRRVLTSRHPEVITKAFGGNPDVAAAWIKDNWYAVHGKVVKGKHGTGPTYWRGKGKKMDTSLDLYANWFEPVPENFVAEVELFCASGADVVEKDGIVWKQALREGKWKHNPIRGARGPLVIDKPFLEELVASFDEGAWEFVTVPLSHADRVHENTGYVRKLKVVEDPKRKNKYVLMAGIEFTEPDIKEKVLRRSIANVSVGVGFNVSRTEDGKMFSKVLKHLALTNMPWINGLQPFGEQLAASIDIPAYEEVEEDEADLSVLAEIELARPAKPKFDESESFDTIRNKISEILGRYRENEEGEIVAAPDNAEYPGVPDPKLHGLYVVGLTGDKVLVNCTGYTPGMTTGWVAEYEVKEDGDIELDPPDEWDRVQKTWVRLSLEFDLVDPEEFAQEDVSVGDETPATEDRPQGSDSNEDDRGGDKMAEEDKETKETTTPEAQFSREDVARIVAEQLNAAREEERTAAAQREEALRVELSKDRKVIHEMRVRERIAELSQNHAPALVKKAEELMLADVEQSDALTLSREDAEVKLSATDIVLEMLAAIPATSLAETSPGVKLSHPAPKDGETSKEDADKLYEELFGPDAKPAHQQA